MILFIKTHEKYYDWALSFFYSKYIIYYSIFIDEPIYSLNLLNIFLVK